jgi:hypothetical protein
MPLKKAQVLHADKTGDKGCFPFSRIGHPIRGGQEVEVPATGELLSMYLLNFLF